MSKSLVASLVIFTLVVCSIFVFLNPVVLAENSEVFSEGEAFTPVNGEYDFRSFSLKDSNTQNFSVKHVISGHTVIVDETGDKVINVIEFDKMVKIKKETTKSFIDGELKKTNWMVDGVCIHEIEFSDGDKMYSACVKDTSTDTMIYIATPSQNETAAMINSLTFK